MHTTNDNQLPDTAGHGRPCHGAADARRRVTKSRKPARYRFNQYRYDRWDTSRSVILEGHFGSDDLTPLHDLAAPDLWRLPADIRHELRHEFYQRGGASADWDKKYAAQDWLYADVQAFRRSRVDLAFDDSEIADRAQQYAKVCTRIVALEAMQDYAAKLGIPAPQAGKPASRTRVGCIHRLTDARWWRAALRRYWTGEGEAHLRAIGFVHKRKQVYASDHMVKCRRGRKARDKALLQSLEAVSDQGEQLELWDVVSKSQANPALRRNELMVRLRGFEECSLAAGHTAQFFTLTCPSAFHRTHVSGERNARFEGYSPSAGQRWLSAHWARVRAKLKRLKILIYGFRIAEPHHDGTPHWHMLLFCAPHHVAALNTVISAYWLKDYADEPGAADHRVQIKAVDPTKGSAAGYLAKYVAKNIDGFNVGEDYETQNAQAIDSSERVLAWASAGRIRQFQQIGGPPVGVYRELRRIRNPVSVAAIEAARVHANVGEWGAFIAALGGIGAGRQGAVTLWTAHSDKPNRYDEPRGQQTIGLVALAGRICTRDKIWRIQRKRNNTGRSDSALLPSLGPVSITVRSASCVPTDDKSKNSIDQAQFRVGIIGLGLGLPRAGPRIN